MHFSRTRLVSATTAGLLLVGTATWASEVDVAVVDVVAPTNAVSLEAGETANIAIRMTVTGSQVGTATFEVHRDWVLEDGTFTGSNPQEFTVGPRGGGDAATTLSTTGTVSVDADQVPGDFTLQVGAFDITNTNGTGAKLAAGDAASYVVTVTAPSSPADTSPPTITPTVSGTLGDNGWYTSDVTVSWTVVDDESPVVSQSGCDTVAVTADQDDTAYTCTARSAGGTASESAAVKRDATAPTVTLTGGPADGAVLYPHQLASLVAPTCDAADDLSGVAGNCEVRGFSTAFGTHAVTATATDMAGNTTTTTGATYTVANYTTRGFFAPVDMGAGVVNTVKGGSTVPLKFEVFAGVIEMTDLAAVEGFRAHRVTCGGEPVEDAIESTSTGGTALRYDTAGGQYIQNWQTPKSPGTCWSATVTLTGGRSIVASFRLK